MNFTIKELNELIYSLGITALNGRMLDKELNQSLMEKLHAELAYQMSLEVEDDYLYIPKEEEIRSHYVSNEEADEDAFKTWNEAPYGNDDEDKEVKEPKGVTQAILNMVERQGDATYTEMNNFYKKVFGSNSFSHILKSLRIPYKNRPTRRYLHKTPGGNYVVKVAGLHNWVEKGY
jgi:hypothetical protein